MTQMTLSLQLQAPQIYWSSAAQRSAKSPGMCQVLESLQHGKISSRFPSKGLAAVETARSQKNISGFTSQWLPVTSSNSPWKLSNHMLPTLCDSSGICCSLPTTRREDRNARGMYGFWPRLLAVCNAEPRMRHGPIECFHFIDLMHPKEKKWIHLEFYF